MQARTLCGFIVAGLIAGDCTPLRAEPPEGADTALAPWFKSLPLTMGGTDPAAGTIDLIFQVVGKSTALLRTLRVGDSIGDTLLRNFATGNYPGSVRNCIPIAKRLVG